MKKYFILIAFIIPTSVSFAQGPPPPPTPSGVPFDGGIVTFLIISILGGVGILSRKRK